LNIKPDSRSLTLSGISSYEDQEGWLEGNYINTNTINQYMSLHKQVNSCSKIVKVKNIEYFYK
jgi:hypothetical protein